MAIVGVMQLTVSQAGEVFVRELDVSKITLRLRVKTDNKGDENDENVVAKLTGDTLTTLKQYLVSMPCLRNVRIENHANRS